ncbi:MAG TPA: substrate-binding domain-containing protein [Bauldia sp.]|nr:substrate-binding domain-containing protein [Bauldia sp.]
MNIPARIASLVSTALLALFAVAVPPRAENEGITVGFSTIILTDQFFVRLQKGMDDAAARLGVTLIHNNPNGDPTAQFKAVENFITQGVDVIIVDAIDPNGIQPALRLAQEAGIPTIAVDEVLDGVEAVTAGVGLSNFEVGKEIGERLLAYAEANDMFPLVIGDIHTLDAPIENARFAGFKSVVDANPDRMRIAGSVDAKFSADLASTGAENLLTANPDLNVFFGSGGIYLEGALAALRSQGATDRVKLVGLDFTPLLVPAFEEGIYVVVAESNPELMGERAIEVAAKLANGEKVERNTGVEVNFRSLEDFEDIKARFGG